MKRNGDVKSNRRSLRWSFCTFRAFWIGGFCAFWGDGDFGGDLVDIFGFFVGVFMFYKNIQMQIDSKL
jgi:hypothetical protein